MRPQPTVARLFAASRRMRSTKAAPRPDNDVPSPFKRTALGPDIPSDIPEPLHLDQMSPRRIKFLQRTINKDKLSDADEAALEEVMRRTELPARPRVEFVASTAGPTLERRTWFAGEEETGTVEAAEDTPGMEAGRVVEIRRNKISMVVVILGSVLVDGRRRLLTLQASGEIWPTDVTGITFIMPTSLVPKELVQACWTEELLQMWASGKDIGVAQPGAEESLIGQEHAMAMFKARREVCALLRKVQRSTENMQARLASGSVAAGGGGSIEAAWEHFVPEDPNERGCVTAVQVAEFLLNSPSTPEAERKKVRPHTLPAFAAHCMLMGRPDVFLADENNTWESDANFLIRSKAERARIEKVTHAVANNTEMLSSFIAKASAVRDALRQGKKDVPAWNEDDLDIIWVLLLPIMETRSLQTRMAVPLCSAIVKEFDAYNKQESDLESLDVTAPLLKELGLYAPSDTLRTSLISEGISRRMTTAGVRPVASTANLAEPTAADAALDSLRQDFSSHRIFVIDSPSAKELDDGISVERIGDDQFWLHTHIADPTRFVARDDPLAVRASFEGTSTYLAEGTMPLLPASLGDGNLSLGATDKPQSVMTFSTRVDREGNIHDSKVQIGFLQSPVITTYAQVNEVLGVSPVSPRQPFGALSPEIRSHEPQRSYTELTESDKADLRLICDLTNAIRAKRWAAAGLDWINIEAAANLINPTTPAANIFDRLTLPTSSTTYPPPLVEWSVTPRAPHVGSENTVAEMAVLANRAAAKFCADRGIPVAFRVSETLKNTTNTPAHLTVEKLLAMRQPGFGLVSPVDIKASHTLIPKTEISTSAAPHWLIGLNKPTDSYIRATSPLRRFDDMLAHWQIKAALGADANIAGADKLLDADTVLKLVTRSDIAQKRNTIFQRANIHFWAAHLLLNRSAGPLPPTFTATDHMVDLQDVPAVVYGTVNDHRGMLRVEVLVPTLGIAADVTFARDELRAKDLVPGAGVRLAFDAARSRVWPNPVINFRPVSSEIIPPLSRT